VRRSGSTSARLALALAAAGLALFLVEQFLVAPVHVTSGSMRPRIWPGDRLVVQRTGAASGIHRGDIVVFRHVQRAGSDRFPGAHSGSGDLVVKRVIGLPGERVQARAGIIGIDNRRVLDEPWLRTPDTTSEFAEVQLGPHEYWVEGDDRAHSSDSRAFGPVPRSAVVGTATFRFWPPRRWGSL
jgi:signal peptidase I